MAPGLAKTSVSSRLKALVLGERAIAQRVAQALTLEGFNPVFLEDISSLPLPLVTDPEALSKLRTIFSSFISLSHRGGIVHPTTTPWAERPEFVGIADQMGLTVLSPSTKVLSLFNNKLSFFLDAERLGVPHLVLSFDPVHSLREIKELHYRSQGLFPFVLKAVHGGGNCSLFISKDLRYLEKSLSLWLDQLRWNTGEVALFVEKYVEGARQITVPFVRLKNGLFRTFPLLDVSLQSKHRKVIEFCPARRVDLEVERCLIRWTRELAQEWDFRGVGNLSFLVDGDRCFLIEGQARLDTGFPLWEKVGGTSAVAWQLAALKGDSFDPSLSPSAPGVEAGILLKILAEDSYLHFPQPGKIEEVTETRNWSFPNFQAELSLNYEVGERIPVHSSGLLGILMVTGESGGEFLEIAEQELSEATERVLRDIWIFGSLQTNELFLSDILAHPWLKEGIFHAGFLDEEYLPPERVPSQRVNAFRYLRDLQAGDLNLLSSGQAAAGVRWLEGPQFWDTSIGQRVSGKMEILGEDDTYRVGMIPFKDRCLVRMGSCIATLRKKGVPQSEVSGQKCGSATGPVLRALCAGRVHGIFFREGSQAPVHEPLIVLEAFGLFVPHALSVVVEIGMWKIRAGDEVEMGQVLAELRLLSKRGVKEAESNGDPCFQSNRENSFRNSNKGRKDNAELYTIC